MSIQNGKQPRIETVTVDMEKLSPKVHGALREIREECYRDGLFPAKYKVLTALAISAVIKCEPCIRMYVQKAVDLNASRQEIVEILNVTMAMGGCPGEAWAHKALLIYEALLKRKGDSDDICCPEE